MVGERNALIYTGNERRFAASYILTPYDHIKAAKQRTIIQPIRWLEHWPLMGGLLHLVQREWAWAGSGPAQSPPRCTKCNSRPINGQCTNFVSFDMAL